MNKLGIQQTSDVLKAICSILADWQKASADGKVTGREKFFLAASNLDEVLAAFSGAGEIPKELADLQREEVDELYRLTLTSLGWQDHSISKSKFDVAWSILYACVNGVRTWQELEKPIRPEVIREMEGIDPP